MTAEEEFVFACKDCGADELVVECYRTYVTEIVETLACECGEILDDPAAEYTNYASETIREYGTLDEEHRWKAEDTEKLESETEEGEHLVHCAQCLNDASAEDWERSEGESEVDDDSIEFYVCCAGCDREIEFGWSHPDRGGRIWPAESSDFNPWKSWPEPRYRESWLKKGWIRPEFRKDTP